MCIPFRILWTQNCYVFALKTIHWKCKYCVMLQSVLITNMEVFIWMNLNISAQHGVLSSEHCTCMCRHIYNWNVVNLWHWQIILKNGWIKLIRIKNKNYRRKHLFFKMQVPLHFMSSVDFPNNPKKVRLVIWPHSKIIF